MSVAGSKSFATLTLLVGIAFIPSVDAATFTTYGDEAAFLAAIGPVYTHAGFDGFASGTFITTQVPGVVFSSPLSGYEGYFPIQAFASPGSISPPNSLAGGFVSGSPDLAQSMVLDFTPSARAFGFYLSPLTPNSIVVSVRVDLTDQTSQTFQVSDHDSNGAEFLGLVSDTGISRVTFESDKSQGGQEGFKQFGLDDLTFVTSDTNPPVCTIQKAIVDGVLGFNGTSTDNGPFDGGVVSITLVDATNVTLTCNAPFPGSCGSISTPTPVATWRIAPTDTMQSGQGRVVATDAGGNSCSVSATFTAFGGGPADGLQVCEAPGISVEASNPESAPSGQIACGSNLPGPGDPPFPPGYEPSPLDDPFPCTVSTIKSPISGITTMVLEKDGDFEPRLRLLYSHFDGTTFPPFVDITESIQEIATVVPDPTRLGGTGVWSQVKVACAILAETCNGLDDDGDGQTDEGYPVGGPARDCDGDGYPQCPTAETTALTCAGETVTLVPGGAVDCNDQLPSIHAGAVERCNGLDDDCDSAIDEEIGTTSCGVGACERTVEACVDHVPQTCVPGDPGTEVCNGLDDDCDGATDEDLGATACGLGVCARTVDNCSGGVPQTCVPGDPGTEVCNGLDDDCDGGTDEEYAFSGYLQPVNADGSSVFQQKSTIPFKFRLNNCAGKNVTTAVATLEVLPYADQVVGWVLESTSASLKPTLGTQYVYDAKVGQYLYNLSTKTLLPNASYIIRTRINDGSVHDVVISLR